jgi:hypothetical protein
MSGEHIGKLILDKTINGDIFQMMDAKYAVYIRDSYAFLDALEKHTGNYNTVYVHIEPNSQANDLYYRFKISMYDATKSPMSFFSVAGSR